MTHLQMYMYNSKSKKLILHYLNIHVRRIVVLLIDHLYIHLQVSPTYAQGLVRFSVKIVEFQILFVPKNLSQNF